jgi:hypothetical protein
MVYRINDVHATKLMIQYANTTFKPEKDWSVARYDSKDCLLGGFVVNAYTGIGGSAELHVCSFRPRWNSKTILYHAFYFPFEVLRVRKLLALMAESNLQCYKSAIHIGFREEALIPDIFPWQPNGYYVLSMYKEDCKWLKMDPVELSIVEGTEYGR